MTTPSRDIADLIAIMAALRDPRTGCPWDLEQTFATIAPYTVEEAHEVADAIARNDLEDLRDELGDLLLQVVYHARLAEEESAFDFADVVLAITGKLIRRHPHVFGDQEARAASAAKGAWERIKADEKRQRQARRPAGSGAQTRLLDDVPASLPALARAIKLQAKAGTVGFDWNDPVAVVAKLREEIDEIEAEIAADDRLRCEAEIGDLLFSVANLARHLAVNPEHALRRTNAKFLRRFAAVEDALAAEDRRPGDVDLRELERLWVAAKGSEQGSGGA